MKTILPVIILALIFSSCNYKRIKGSGKVATESRNISNAKKIKLAGSYDVVLIPGTTTSVKIEGDDNILPHVITEIKDDFLVIKTEDHIDFSTDNKLTVYITTPIIEEVRIAGSGNIITKGKLTGGDKLKINIAGSGDMTMEVNTPKVEANISGSGNIEITGETKEEEIRITGHGAYKAENLKAENANVHITGSGDVVVFADVKLDIHITGSGTVSYKGNAAVKQNITGSGDVVKL